MNSDFLQTLFHGQVKDAEHEKNLHFNFQGHLQGQIEGQRAGAAYRSKITYVSKRTKMASSDSL